MARWCETVLGANPNVDAMSLGYIPCGPMHSQTSMRVCDDRTRARLIIVSYSEAISFDGHRIITGEFERVRVRLVSEGRSSAADEGSSRGRERCLRRLRSPGAV